MSDNVCEKYERHKNKYSDYNLLGQALKLECKVLRTNFDDEESVKSLKLTAMDVADTIRKIIKE